MPCLSTADYTIAVSGALIEEVELLTYPNGPWSQSRVTNSWTVTALQMLMYKVINYGSTEVDRGERSGLCFGAYLCRM